MKFKNLTDDELEFKIKSLVAKEREVTLLVIEHLQEVYDRRFYAKKGYSSLYEYCRKELKYSEGASYRRVACVKLIKDIPEAKIAIEKGSLTLSSCAQIQSFCQKTDSRNIELKKDLVKKVENKSKAETESLLMSINSEVQRLEKVRLVADDAIEVRITISKELKAKLDRVKNLNSHKKLNPSYTELLEYLADEELKKLDKKTKVKPRITSQRCGDSEIPDGSTSQRCEKTESPDGSTLRRSSTKNPRYISANVKRKVWQRDQCECQYTDPKTGQVCQSKSLLEIHHKKSVALGGKSTLDNLTLYCKTHNSYQAIKDLGWQKMSAFYNLSNPSPGGRLENPE